MIKLNSNTKFYFCSYKIFNIINHLKMIKNGDWGLGIGDWAQSPIPNPQSPIPNPHFLSFYFYKYIKYINYPNKNIYFKKKKII